MDCNIIESPTLAMRRKQHRSNWNGVRLRPLSVQTKTSQHHSKSPIENSENSECLNQTFNTHKSPRQKKTEMVYAFGGGEGLSGMASLKIAYECETVLSGVSSPILFRTPKEMVYDFGGGEGLSGMASLKISYECETVLSGVSSPILFRTPKELVYDFGGQEGLSGIASLKIAYECETVLSGVPAPIFFCTPKQNSPSSLNSENLIDLHGKNLKQIEKLSTKHHPSILDLSCNAIEKIENLDNLDSIKELKLYGNNIVIVENLETLRQLQYLKLQHNQIKSFGSRIRCPDLHTLRIDHNNLEEIKSSHLIGCPNLCSLNVSSNNLESLSFLKILPALEELVASGNQISDLSDISTCQCLRELDISDNQLTDISGIKNVTTLEALNVSDNNLTDMKDAGRHTSLTDLQIQGNKLTTTEHICNQFPNLEVLNLSFNLIQSWDEVINLKNLASLTELVVKCNPYVHRHKYYHADLVEIIISLQWLDGISVKQNMKILKNSNARQTSASAGITGNDLNKQLESFELSRAIIDDITESFKKIRSNISNL